jgi:hypothetical protein
MNEYKYRTLCKLYRRYKIAIKLALDNVDKIKTSDEKMNELDSIMKGVEKTVIPWSFYNSQKVKFDSEFENIMVFKEDSISI